MYDGARMQVYLYGGQVTSWKNELGEELLFVSSKVLAPSFLFSFLMHSFSLFILTCLQANFTPPKSIRGGIPLCFPQVRLLSSSLELRTYLHHFNSSSFSFHIISHAGFKSWPS
ncbi:hypothetical protein PIB30_012688 [Stylosanthes scabra]|uniref:Uncharacterized protein n=1 Tax=Stylosanthes scabra TaxID=79078 RepID=A0ABU6Q6X4_9FABA|nr:hypothetical protein [Stylosanthes scabra]